MAYPNTQQNFYGYPNQMRLLNLPQTQEVSKMKNLSGTHVIQSAEKNLNRVIDLFF